MTAPDPSQMFEAFRLFAAQQGLNLADPSWNAQLRDLSTQMAERFGSQPAPAVRAHPGDPLDLVVRRLQAVIDALDDAGIAGSSERLTAEVSAARDILEWLQY